MQNERLQPVYQKGAKSDTRKIRSDIPAGHSFLHLQVGSGHGEELARGAGPGEHQIAPLLLMEQMWLGVAGVQSSLKKCYQAV